MDLAEEAFHKRQDDLTRLQAKLDEAKAKHRALMMRRETAEQRIRVRTQTYDTRVDDALARYANVERKVDELEAYADTCLLYTSPSPRDQRGSRMPSSA